MFTMFQNILREQMLTDDKLTNSMMTLTSSSSSISTFDSALMGDMQKVIVVMMTKFCFLHLVQKYAGHILIQVNSDLNIAKGTTDPGVDCFDQ